MSSSVEMKKPVPHDLSWISIDDICDPEYTEKWLCKSPAGNGSAEDLNAYFVKKGFKMTTMEELCALNSRDTEEWVTYRKQLKEHGIFSVTSFPKNCGLYSLGVLRNQKIYINHAKKVIDDHNRKEGTKYEFKEMLNGVGMLYGASAHLQFEAVDPDHGVKIFESQSSWSPSI